MVHRFTNLKYSKKAVYRALFLIWDYNIKSQKSKKGPGESKHFKVVLDLGNGAQAVSAPNFCEILGCETFLVNPNIDGSFPGRGSEPTPQNLSELSKTVRENNADVGIAFDGDGDRSIFCDNNGDILTGDKSALVLTQHILKKNPNSLVITCLNSGSNIEVLAEKFNSKVIRTKVGSVEVSRKMVPTNALIGFAGPRVVKETIGKDLPEGFQRSEFLLEHGFLDFIVERKSLKTRLTQYLNMVMS